MVPDSAFTLGGLAAVAAGECAPAASSGFCSGGTKANGPGSTQGGIGGAGFTTAGAGVAPPCEAVVGVDAGIFAAVEAASAAATALACGGRAARTRVAMLSCTRHSL